MKFSTFFYIGFSMIFPLDSTVVAETRGNDGNSSAPSEQGIEVLDPLSDTEAKKLQFMRQEEKLARDVYRSLYAIWKDAAFEDNANTEQEHMDKIKKMLDRYGLADPIVDDSIGSFTDENFSTLFNSMTWSGNSSLTEALKVSAVVEEMDIDELQQSVAETTKEDLRRIYLELLQGSKEHLRIVVRQFESMGDTYKAQFLSQQEVNEILASINDWKDSVKQSERKQWLIHPWLYMGAQQETCKRVSKSTEKKLTDKDLANLQKRYRHILTRGELELPPIPPKPSGKRGKLAKSDAHNLLERLKAHEPSVLLFAKDPHVSFPIT